MPQLSLRLGLKAFPLLLAAFVMGCAPEPEPEFGECEPGVSDLSRSATVCP